MSGIPRAGLKGLAVIVETESGLRMAYMIDVNRHHGIEIVAEGTEPGDIVLHGTLLNHMNIWDGSIPASPMREVTR